MFHRHPVTRCLALISLLAACSTPAPPPTGTPAGGEAATAPAVDAKPKKPTIGPSVHVDPDTGFSVNSSTIPTAAGTVIGGINAFCEPADVNHTRPGGNVSPHINWKNAPEGTKSFALFVVDPDAPASGDTANKDNMTIPKDAPRIDFYHWVVTNIPANRTRIEEGASARGVVPGGKPPGDREFGREGLNDYSRWLEGDYAGWDGPCPPWNDERIHRYIFELFALDIENLHPSGPFTGPDAKVVMEGHILAKASFTGIYILNPGVSLPPAG